MLRVEHSAILLTFIKLPFVIKFSVYSIFEWPFYIGFTVQCVLQLKKLMRSWLPLRNSAFYMHMNVYRSGIKIKKIVVFFIPVLFFYFFFHLPFCCYSTVKSFFLLRVRDINCRS